MWSYYGAKTKIVKLYPYPKKDIIVEPFCGSARYSLMHFEKEVHLYDTYPVIIDLWKWLQQCSKQDILGLPDSEQGKSVEEFDIPQEAKWLMGFCINGGSAQPKKTPQKRDGWSKDKKYIANNLFKIKHWNIHLGTYTKIKNIDATWFIDPPYQVGGEWYVHGNKGIDYPKLAKWCMSRKGQVIVCENTKADWLPFVPMIGMNGNFKRTTEAIWSNQRHNFSYVQGKLL